MSREKPRRKLSPEEFLRIARTPYGRAVLAVFGFIVNLQLRAEKVPSHIHNERIKLTANLFNIVAGFALTVGGLGPLIGVTYGLPGTSPHAGGWTLFAITGVWVIVGVGFHRLARWLLGRLRP